MRPADELREEFIARTQAAGLGGQLLRDEPLSRHCSYRLGGPVDLYVSVTKEEDLIGWVRQAQTLGYPWRVLGGGTNILVADVGVRGLVIENRCRGHQLREEQTLSVSAGVSFAGLARRMARDGYQGLEWASGIPGTLGGAVVNNAGAYGGSVADVLRRVRLLEVEGTIKGREATAAELGFGYRTSLLKTRRAGVVLSAEFAVGRQDPKILSARVERLDEHRRRTQPREPSAGSVFKNPPGDYAGRLIEAAGLKGERLGGAQISALHANYFINAHQATALEVAQLIQRARDAVWQKFRARLDLEIELIGEWDESIRLALAN